MSLFFTIFRSFLLAEPETHLMSIVADKLLEKLQADVEQNCRKSFREFAGRHPIFQEDIECSERIEIKMWRWFFLGGFISGLWHRIQTVYNKKVFFLSFSNQSTSGLTKENSPPRFR